MHADFCESFAVERLMAMRLWCFVWVDEIVASEWRHGFDLPRYHFLRIDYSISGARHSWVHAETDEVSPDSSTETKIENGIKNNSINFNQPALLTDMFELQGVVVLAYPELEGSETIDHRRQLSWILFAESLLNGMNWKWLVLGELIRGLSRGERETGDSERGLKQDVKLIRCTAGLRSCDVWWCNRRSTTGHSDESFRLFAFKDGADLPKWEFLNLTKFDGVSRMQNRKLNWLPELPERKKMTTFSRFQRMWGFYRFVARLSLLNGASANIRRIARRLLREFWLFVDIWALNIIKIQNFSRIWQFIDFGILHIFL